MVPLSEERQDLHGAVAAERTAPPLSFYDADAEQVQLFALREECETDEERAEIDKPLKAYVESELEKVTPLTALFVCFKNNAAAGRADEERIQKDRARWLERYELLKRFVYENMVARGKELVTSAAARFRLQDNPAQVEVVDESKIEEKYMVASLSMPAADWKRLREAADNYVAILQTNTGETLPPIAMGAVTFTPDRNALKTALLNMVPCVDCRGAKCKKCGGATMVPVAVPGAKLKRTSHLRIE